jgi:hypothetical protein
VLLRSTVGRVVLGSVEGPLDVLRAMARSYALHMRPCTLEVLDTGPGRANVGVFEGCLRYAEAKGDVRIHAYDRATADLLCTWQAPAG